MLPLWYISLQFIFVICNTVLVVEYAILEHMPSIKFLVVPIWTTVAEKQNNERNFSHARNIVIFCKMRQEMTMDDILCVST